MPDHSPDLWPELFAALPAPWADAFDGARPWDLLGAPLDEILSALGEDQIDIRLPPDIHLIGAGFHIGRGTRIGPGAVLVGPLRLGRDVEIRPGATLRGGCWLGDGCVVGASSELKRAILLDGAKAPHLNYVGDSILGRAVNLGAGTVLSNFRHDGGEISIPRGGVRVSTGRKKLGALLGDGARTGCNAVLHPGTIVGEGTEIYPGVQLRPGTYPANSIVKLRQDQEIVTRGPREEDR